MSQRSHVGRHRHAVRYSPVAELSSIARAAAGPGARAGSVLVASGGLVATFALPASAAQMSEQASYVASADTASAFAAATPRAVTAAPAVVAPEAAAPVAAETVGVVGVKGVAKPEPEPEPEPEPVTPAPASTSSPAPAAAPAPEPEPVADVAQSASGVVNIARGLLGIPYSYGGTTPSGFDCSGFTSYVFAQAGISLPRTAEQQRQAATPVSDPQPGDLVFFGAPAWHVGIYTGNGMMIDSPREGKSTSERPVFSGVSGYGRF